MSPLVQLAPGAIFAGDFRVVKHLSAGGMGAVYVVEQLSTAKHRALKLMHPQLGIRCTKSVSPSFADGRMIAA